MLLRAHVWREYEEYGANMKSMKIMREMDYVRASVCVVLRKHVFDENSFVQVCFFARMRDRACAHIVAHMYVLREFEEFARSMMFARV